MSVCGKFYFYEENVIEKCKEKLCISNYFCSNSNIIDYFPSFFNGNTEQGQSRMCGKVFLSYYEGNVIEGYT